MVGTVFHSTDIGHQAWRSNIRCPSHPRPPRWPAAPCCTTPSAAEEIAQLNPPPALQHTRLVLVAPKDAGNVGAVMRLAENFEVLHVVAS